MNFRAGFGPLRLGIRHLQLHLYKENDTLRGTFISENKQYANVGSLEIEPSRAVFPPVFELKKCVVQHSNELETSEARKKRSLVLVF